MIAKKAIWLVIAFLSSSCHSQEKLSNLTPIPNIASILRGNVAVYVESKTPKEEITADRFGDVVILNLDTKERAKITHDEFVNEFPTLSPDRKLIVFASLREGDPELLKIVGMGGPRKLYAYEIETGRLRYYAPHLDDRYPDIMSRFHQIRWSPVLPELFFASGNMILAVSRNEDSLWLVYRDTTIQFILDFSFSPNGKYISVLYIQERPEGVGRNIFNVTNHSVNPLPDPDSVDIIGGNSLDRNSVLLAKRWYVTKSIFEFDCSQLTRHILQIPGLGTQIDLEKVYYVDDSTLVGLGGKLIYRKPPVDSSTFRNPVVLNKEILRVDLRSQTVDTLTNDHLRKGYLQIYPARR